MQRLLSMLVPEVRRWLDEQKGLVDERRYRGFIAVAERFDDLSKSAKWVANCFGRKHRWEPDPDEFEAMLALAAIAAAAGTVAPHALADRPVPAEVIEAFLRLWRADRRCGSRVTAPQVAVAYLSGSGWSPTGVPVLDIGWEPARLFLQAMPYKSTCHGLHQLANWHLTPLSLERQFDRACFETRVVRAMHYVTARLTSSGDCEPGDTLRLVHWDCEKLSLWEFLSGAILGPGRKGATGDAGRPLPGAIDRCLLGQWARDELRITVGTVELYVCTECPGFQPEPSCVRHPLATTVATWRRHTFVTPRWVLPEHQRDLGHEKVQRKICKDLSCVKRLHHLLGRDRSPGQRFTLQPIYRNDADECPYCHSWGAAGQRPLTVWTRFP